ncbi:MAG: hypothetical protein KC731_04365 [Myxococcales bacterium]|nr:hypothetical protein [Myxococcales bacterium]
MGKKKKSGQAEEGPPLRAPRGTKPETLEATAFGDFAHTWQSGRLAELEEVADDANTSLDELYVRAALALLEGGSHDGIESLVEKALPKATQDDRDDTVSVIVQTYFLLSSRERAWQDTLAGCRGPSAIAAAFEGLAAFERLEDQDDYGSEIDDDEVAYAASGPPLGGQPPAGLVEHASAASFISAPTAPRGGKAYVEPGNKRIADLLKQRQQLENKQGADRSVKALVKNRLTDAIRTILSQNNSFDRDTTKRFVDSPKIDAVLDVLADLEDPNDLPTAITVEMRDAMQTWQREEIDDLMDYENTPDGEQP